MALAQTCVMKPTATIDVWSDEVDARRCLVAVYRDGCQLEMHAHGQVLVTQRCPSVPEAMDQAERWRPLFLTVSPIAA
jgi:hypothetical protein